MALYPLILKISSLLLPVFQHAYLEMMMMMIIVMMNNQNKSQLLGVSVFMVRGGTKTCASVSYLIEWSSSQARVFESFYRKTVNLGEFAICAAE